MKALAYALRTLKELAALVFLVPFLGLLWVVQVLIKTCAVLLDIFVVTTVAVFFAVSMTIAIWITRREEKSQSSQK